MGERPEGARRGGDAKDGDGAEAHGACLVRVRVRVRVSNLSGWEWSSLGWGSSGSWARFRVSWGKNRSFGCFSGYIC